MSNTSSQRINVDEYTEDEVLLSKRPKCTYWEISIAILLTLVFAGSTAMLVVTAADTEHPERPLPPPPTPPPSPPSPPPPSAPPETPPPSPHLPSRPIAPPSPSYPPALPGDVPQAPPPPPGAPPPPPSPSPEPPMPPLSPVEPYFCDSAILGNSLTVLDMPSTFAQCQSVPALINSKRGSSLDEAVSATDAGLCVFCRGAGETSFYHPEDLALLGGSPGPTSVLDLCNHLKTESCECMCI